MQVSSTCSLSCLGVPKMATAKLNRKALQSVGRNLSVLNGPAEKSAAKAWVAAYTAGNAGIAALMAQAPGADELALAGVEVVMATHIFNGIYDFNFSRTALKSLATGVAGHAIGKTTFKLASKSLTWIPGIGNALNAIVSGSTTLALGSALISMAEDMDDARRRGKKLDEFIKKMEE